MSQALQIEAPAKFNLVLRVAGVDERGYHPLMSLMVALDGLSDTLTVRRASQRRVECPGVPQQSNLVWKALDHLQDATGQAMDLDIQVAKRIPSPGGLGGGSSDAAAALWAARQVYDLPLNDVQLQEVAAKVGADAPFFVRGGAQWATGYGERLAPATVAPFTGVLTRPTYEFPTPAVYRAFDRVCRPAELPPTPPDVTSWWASPHIVNDLWPAALSVQPAIARTARYLHAAGAERVLLCGSGGTMIALWREPAAARDACAQLGDMALAVVTPAAPRPPEGRH